MPRVFISHSSRDRDLVENEIVPTLTSVGLETWYSKDNIRVAEHWERAIVKGLESCDWFVLVMSPHAAKSAWVHDELNWALSHLRDRIVPVLYEECDPIEFHLSLPRIQYVDFRQPNSMAKQKLLSAFGVNSLKDESETACSELENEIPVIVAPKINAPLSHFHCGPWVPANYFIGREEELAEAKHLIGGRQSFLIVGDPRAGKTSFCHKIKQDYDSNPQSNVLISYLNLQQCSELTIERFLEHTILNISGEIARKVFGCRYSDLKHSSPTDLYPKLRNDAVFQSFIDIFKHLSERTHKRDGTHPDPLVPREFVAITRDLLEIASDKGRSGFVILYDEANRLPVDISGNVLLSIGEALNETGVTGGYVASPTMESEFEKLDQLFGARLVVGPFRSKEMLRQLLARYYFDDVNSVRNLPVDDGAVDTLWSLSGGVPFIIQLIADRSFRIARQQESSILTKTLVDDAYSFVRKDRPNAFQ